MAKTQQHVHSGSSTFSTPLPLVRVRVEDEEILAGYEAGSGEPEDNVWVIIKRVCEGLGIDDWRQGQKLKGKPWATTNMKLVVAEDGKTREMLCISLRSLPLWLATIEPSRVAEAVRPRLLAFQIRCREVLYKHFFGGGASLTANDVIRIVDERLERLRPVVEAPQPALVTLPASGVIGKRTAGAYIRQPINQIARLTMHLVGAETDEKKRKRQMARYRREVDNELRVRLGYHLAAAQSWDMVTEMVLGEAMRHLANMLAQVSGRLHSRQAFDARDRQGSFGFDLMRMQKDALKPS
jgi:hypothetical protein